MNNTPSLRGIIVKLILLILGGGVFFVSNLEDRPTQKIPPPEGVLSVWISFVATPLGHSLGPSQGPSLGPSQGPPFVLYIIYI